MKGLIFPVLLLAIGAAAQNCPKVAYTTPTATTKSLVAAVNCLNGQNQQAAAPAPAAPKAGASGKSMQVESFQIIGPQHTHAYSSVVMAVLTVNTGGVTKSAVVTPESREATVTAEAGGTCSVKLNSDKTIDSHCYIAGGTVYVVYR